MGGGGVYSQWHDQTTVPGVTSLNLGEKCVGSLTFPANQNREDAGDWGYGLWSLSEKTRMSNHLSTPLVWTILSPARTKEPKSQTIVVLHVTALMVKFKAAAECETSLLLWQKPTAYFTSTLFGQLQPIFNFNRITSNLSPCTRDIFQPEFIRRISFCHSIVGE